MSRIRAQDPHGAIGALRGENHVTVILCSNNFTSIYLNRAGARQCSVRSIREHDRMRGIFEFEKKLVVLLDHSVIVGDGGGATADYSRVGMKPDGKSAHSQILTIHAQARWMTFAEPGSRRSMVIVTVV